MAFFIGVKNMPEKDPTTYTALTYLWVGLLASGGGLVKFIRRLNEQEKPQNLWLVFAKLAGELIVSGFAGLITFYLFEHLNVSPLLTAVCVGISGYMGGNFIDLVSNKLEKFITKKFDELDK